MEVGLHGSLGVLVQNYHVVVTGSVCVITLYLETTEGNYVWYKKPQSNDKDSIKKFKPNFEINNG